MLLMFAPSVLMQVVAVLIIAKVPDNPRPLSIMDKIPQFLECRRQHLSLDARTYALPSYTAEQAIALLAERGHTDPQSIQYIMPHTNSAFPDPLRQQNTDAPMLNTAILEAVPRYIQLKHLKELFQAKRMPASGTRAHLCKKLFEWLFESEEAFMRGLWDLARIVYSDQSHLNKPLLPFRVFKALDARKLAMAARPLPFIRPWMIREELTPVIFTHLIPDQVDCPIQSNADNFCCLTIYPTPNTMTILQLYHLVSTDAPDLTAAANLQAAQGIMCSITTPLAGETSVARSTHSGRQFAGTAGCNLSGHLPPHYHSGPVILWLWRLREQDQLAIQVIRAVPDPRRFPAAPVVPALLPKSQVLSTFLMSAHCQDIELSTLTVSLRCPISLARISRPIRSRHCIHLQCFDHSSLQVISRPQQTEYTCPICHSSCPVSSLCEDEYFAEILARAKNCHSARIDPRTGEYSFAEEEDGDSGEDGDEHIASRHGVTVLDSDEFMPRGPMGSSWLNPIIIE